MGEGFARWVHRLEARLQAIPFGQFTSLIFALIVLQNGLWVIPNVETLRLLSTDLSRNMLENRPGETYLYSSFLGLALAHFAQASQTLFRFVFFHFLCLCVSYLALAWALKRKYGEAVARLVLLAFATLPLSNILCNWLGISDVFVFLFGTGLVICDSLILLAVFSFLLGLAHGEQALLITAGVGFVGGALRHSQKQTTSEIRKTLVMIGSALGAKLALNGYFASHGFHLQTTRFNYVFKALIVVLEDFARNFQAEIFSLYHVGWLFLVPISFLLWKRDRISFWALTLSQMAYLGVTMLVLDETRDFALLSWPLVVLLLTEGVQTKRFRLEELSRLLLPAFFLSLVLPKLIVWEGRIHSTAIFYDFVFLLDRMGLTHLISGNPHWADLPFY